MGEAKRRPFDDAAAIMRAAILYIGPLFLSDFDVPIKHQRDVGKFIFSNRTRLRLPASERSLLYEITS